MTQQPIVDQRLLIIENSRSHSDTKHSVGLRWASDQPDAETYTWQHSQETGFHAPEGTRTHNLTKRAAADPRLKEKSEGTDEDKTLLLFFVPGFKKLNADQK